MIWLVRLIRLIRFVMVGKGWNGLVWVNIWVGIGWYGPVWVIMGWYGLVWVSICYFLVSTDKVHKMLVKVTIFMA